MWSWKCGNTREPPIAGGHYIGMREGEAGKGTMPWQAVSPESFGTFDAYYRWGLPSE
jgi:hypothetical protein